jgi:hypothetical protein
LVFIDPPDKALVLCVDEKSQIHALDRTQPGLPMKKGRAGIMTHDYKRNSTTTLFAALNMLDGEVIGSNLNLLSIISMNASAMFFPSFPRLSIIWRNDSSRTFHLRAQSALSVRPPFFLTLTTSRGSFCG